MPRRKKADKIPEKKTQKSQELTSKDFIYTHGGRKTATARVRLYSKPGKIIVNDKPIEEYFPAEIAKRKYQKPLILTDTLDKVSATIKVAGSGKNGQLDAIVHGIARALVTFDSEFRKPLRAAGLLTRDPRAKERRKYGLAQKARKGKQSPKR